MVEVYDPSRTSRASTAPGSGPELGFPEHAKVVWALDAFPDQDDLQISAAWLIEKLFPESTVFPVYVLSESAFSDRGFSDFLRPALKPMAAKAMTSLIDEAHNQLGHWHIDCKMPRVLIEFSNSQEAAARRLVRFADKIGADLITLASHGRKGLSRMLSGSFSEAILTQSHKPVLLSGPRLSTVPWRPSVIVYPTDFSPACEAGFTQILKLARHFQAEIHLFHKTVHNIDPIIQSGVHLLGGGWVSLESYLDPTSDVHRPDAESWIDRATTLGVTVRYLSENFREPASEAIVDYARNTNQASALIAMVPQSGPVASALLGSVTRDVIRLSPCPVYLVPHGLIEQG